MAEINAVLGEGDAKVFNYHYGVRAEGNVEAAADPHHEFSGKNILIQRYSIPQTAQHFSLTTQQVTK
jgi:uncharacterized protein YyaL (SSP411 family)